jgi:crotonobetainyl-CoA:carnitine CoA-transferase CaiB-like acyl-CoA transferase
MGAEVIKIENPIGGDMTRNLVPWVFEAYNGGKRSLAVATEADLAVDVIASKLSTHRSVATPGSWVRVLAVTSIYLDLSGQKSACCQKAAFASG